MATPLIREVNADLVKRGSTRAVYAKQNDYNSRFLNVRIQEDGKDKTIDPSAIITLNVQRSDQQKNYFYGEVNEDGTVKVPLTAWMLETEGTLACDISIIYEGEKSAKLTTMQFNIYVEASVNPESAFIETEEYSIIVDLLDRTEEAAKKAEEAAAAVIDCEEATSRANDAADKANAVREEVEAGGYIESLKELNNGDKFTFWVGTQEEYDLLSVKKHGCLYIITDDTTLVDLQEDIDEAKTDYVVRQGVTSDGWTFRQWKSGIGECWIRVTQKLLIADYWAGTENSPTPFYVSTLENCMTLTFPLEFSSKPHISTSIYSTDYTVFEISFRNEMTTSRNFVTPQVARPIPLASPIEVTFIFDVKGICKQEG